MRIVYEGPNGAKLQMDIPAETLEAFQLFDSSGALTKIVKDLGGRFYTTVIIALMMDLSLMASGVTLPRELIGIDKFSKQFMLLRFHECLETFAEQEIHAAGEKPRSN